MNKNEMNKRKIKGIETKNKIYNTANELFKKYGFENVSVDSIVEEAGVSKGTFYVHFDSKDSLAAAIINDFVSKADYNYKSFIQSFHSQTAISDILILLIEKIADMITDTIGYQHMKALYKAQITKTINTDAVMGYNRELYNMFSEIISKGIHQGEFKSDLSVDTLTKHYIMAIRGLTYEWCIRYPDFDLKEQAVVHFEILLNGIKKQ
jgi:AcrR family transcriptional regulator